MGRGSHSHRSVSRPGRRWPGTCSGACRTGWRRLAAGEEASSAIAGPGRAGARPSHAALGGTSSKRPSPDNEENVMNYHGLVKRLDLPAVRIPPRSWNTTTSGTGRSAAPATTTMRRASMPASSLFGGPAAAAGRPSRSASTSTTSMRSGTNASSVRAARSPTPCTTPAASTPDAATCTRWDGAPL